MNNYKLNYTKITGNRPLLSDEIQNTDNLRIEKDYGKPESSDYTPKNTKTRRTDIFFIISGGEKKERLYFNKINDKDFPIKIEFTCPQGKKSGKNKHKHRGSSPKDILSFWKEIYDANRNEIIINNNNFEILDKDSVYFITDLDSFRNDLIKELNNNSQNNKYKWIISNPCFEIWIYYNIFESLNEKLKKDLEEEEEIKRPQKLKEFLKTKNIDPRKLVEKETIQNAIQNSEKYCNKYDKDNIPVLFSTEIRNLAEKILKRIENII